MRRIWGVTAAPTSADLQAAAAAGAAEIVEIPCPALPDLTPGYQEIAEPDDPPTDLPTARQQQLAALAALRWTRSLSMAYVVGGATYALPCDTEAATNVLGAIVGLQLANATGPVQWKLGAGVFADLNLTDLIALGQAMRSHVQACFVNEATLSAQIMGAESAQAALAVDLTQGWP